MSYFVEDDKKDGPDQRAAERDDTNLSTVAQPATASAPTPTPALGAASVGSYGPTQTHNPAGPSRFINFSAYFNANRGAAQGAGNRLANRLGTEADSVSGDIKKTEGGITTGATANTLAAPTPGLRVEPNFGGGLDSGSVERAQADRRSKTVYGGPTADTVNAAYDPLASRADTLVNGIKSTTDAAGTKALLGGTGFDATLANVGAGGRLSQLRQKYGGLSQAVTDSRNLALGAANTAADTTKSNAASYGKMVNDYDAGEAARLDYEKNTQNAATKHGWDGAINQANQRGGGHIVTTGSRPDGKTFVDSFPKGEWGTLNVDTGALARVYDALPDDVAQRVLAWPVADPMGMLGYLKQMADKYGVK